MSGQLIRLHLLASITVWNLFSCVFLILINIISVVTILFFKFQSILIRLLKKIAILIL